MERGVRGGGGRGLWLRWLLRVAARGATAAQGNSHNNNNKSHNSHKSHDNAQPRPGQLTPHPGEQQGEVWRRVVAAGASAVGGVWMAWAVTGVLAGDRATVAGAEGFFREVAWALRGADEVERVEVVRWMCVVLWRAGWTERAVAILQAMLEANGMTQRRFGPGDRAALGDFWASGLPRIGDSPRAGLGEEGRGAPAASGAGGDPVAAWCRRESLLCQARGLPVRPGFQGIDLEPSCAHREVHFDQVLPFLFVCETSEGRVALCHALVRLLDPRASPIFSDPKIAPREHHLMDWTTDTHLELLGQDDAEPPSHMLEMLSRALAEVAAACAGEPSLSRHVAQQRADLERRRFGVVSEASRAAVEDGLRLHPLDPGLLMARCRLDVASGRMDSAFAAYAAAIEATAAATPALSVELILTILDKAGAGAGAGGSGDGVLAVVAGLAAAAACRESCLPAVEELANPVSAPRLLQARAGIKRWLEVPGVVPAVGVLACLLDLGVKGWPGFFSTWLSCESDLGEDVGLELYTSLSRVATFAGTLSTVPEVAAALGRGVGRFPGERRLLTALAVNRCPIPALPSFDDNVTPANPLPALFRVAESVGSSGAPAAAALQALEAGQCPSSPLLWRLAIRKKPELLWTEALRHAVPLDKSVWLTATQKAKPITVKAFHDAMRARGIAMY